MKTKRLMSIVLALAMLCTMFGNLTAFALPGINSVYYTVKTVDGNGNAVTGVKFRHEYNYGSSCVADGDTIHEITVDKRMAEAEVDFEEIPAGYRIPDDFSETISEMNSYIGTPTRDDLVITKRDEVTYNSENSCHEYVSEASVTVYDLVFTLESDVEKEFNLTVKTQDKDGVDVELSKYSMTYYNAENTSGVTENDCTVGTAKAVKAYEESNFTISFNDISGYKKPEQIVFNPKDIASLSGTNYSVTDDGENNYTLTITLEEETTYTITPDFLYTEAATYAIDKTEAAEGEEVKVTVSNIKVGWSAWTMVVIGNGTDDSLDPVVPGEPEEDGSYVYTFTMPAYNVKVDVNMNEILYYVNVSAGKDDDEEITEGLKYTLNVGDNNYTEADEIELSYADAHDKEATLTITAVPTGYKMPTVVTKTFTFGESFTEEDIFKQVNNSNDLYYVIHVILEEDDSDDNDTDNEERTETTFKLTVNTVCDGENVNQGMYNITYWNKEHSDEYGMTESSLILGNANTEITSYEDSDIKITFESAGTYKIPDEISFKASEIATASGDNWSVSAGDEDNSYVLNVTVTPETFLPPAAGGDDILPGDDDDDDTDETTPFTVKAVVNSATTDVDGDKEGTQVNAKDTVKVDVAVSGGAFTNADWEMIYDPTLFEYKGTTTNVDTSKSTVKLDDTKTAVLSGSLTANAGLTEGDEFADGTAIVTYEFTAKAQNADKVGTFKIESAHANNYVIAGTQDNKVANAENTTVEIVLVDDTEDKDDETGTVTVPAGTFTAAEKVYNAQKQTGNAFELDEDFSGAKVTYAAAEEGKEKEELTYKTTLPSWKDVGTYTYYAKIYGDGLKTTYVSTTLTIKPAELIPSAMFAVDPSTGTNDLEFIPTLEGALDDTHTGTVTVKYTDINGEKERILDASDFVYDGETTSVYKEAIKVTAATSGEFVVTLTYNDGTEDNYTGTTNTAKVDVDKITADEVTVKALEETITSVFGYDATAHSVEINADAVTTVTSGDWKYTISDAEASVTNVGEDKMVKVTFTDKNGVYNDVIVYVILKVTPANVKITVDDKSKVMNDTDPDLTGTIQVVDENGDAVEGMEANKLYGTDDLEVSYERDAGEAVGTYNITASYAPNDNYTVEVVDGEFEITAPSTDDSDPENPAKVKIEVVDLSYQQDGTPDYTAGKRLILVYTDIDKLFYGYSTTQSADDAEKMFDVTAAGYKYTKYTYADDGTVTADVDNETAYKHIYGIVVDKLESEKTGAALEAEYKANVVFLGSSLDYRADDIVYDGNINLSTEIDVNDYSMANGIYNNKYDRATYIKNILKADINGDKKVDTTDVLDVKTIFEAKNK